MGTLHPGGPEASEHMSQIAPDSMNVAVTNETLAVIGGISSLMFARPIGVHIGKGEPWVRSHFQYMILTIWIGLAHGVIFAVPLLGTTRKILL
jgi:uncharacterized membrane protein